MLLHLSRALALTPPYKSTPPTDDGFQSNQPTNNVRSASAMARLKVSNYIVRIVFVPKGLIESEFQAIILASAAATVAASGDAYYGHSRRRAAWPYSFGGFSRVVSDGLGDGRDFYSDSEEAWAPPSRPHAREAQFGGYAGPVSTSHASFTIGGTSSRSAINHGAGTSFGSSSSSFGAAGLPRLAGAAGGGFAAEDSYGAPEPAYSVGNSFGGGFGGSGFGAPAGFGDAFSPSESLPTYVPDLFENLPDPFEPAPPGMDGQHTVAVAVVPRTPIVQGKKK